MRSVLSALSILLAVVLTAAAVPSLWIERNVVDEGGFVRLLEPLRSDAAFQSSLANSLATTVASASGVPQAFQPAAARLANEITNGLTTDPGFPGAWDETLRESHRLNFSQAVASNSTFTLELRPFVDVLLKRLGSGLGVQAGQAPSIQVPVGTPQQRSWLTAAQEAASYAWPLTVGAVLAFALGFLFARRRGVALGWSGLGLLLVAAVLAAGAFFASGVASAQGGSGSVATVFATRAGKLFADSFLPWAGVVALVGAAFLILAIALGARRRAASGRR